MYQQTDPNNSVVDQERRRFAFPLITLSHRQTAPQHSRSDAIFYWIAYPLSGPKALNCIQLINLVVDTCAVVIRPIPWYCPHMAAFLISLLIARWVRRRLVPMICRPFRLPNG